MTREERTILPVYNDRMRMVVTGNICPECIPAIVEKTKEYAGKAADGTPWQEGYGLKHNDVIENFVSFFINRDMEFTIKIRYMESVEQAIETIHERLDRMASGEIVLTIKDDDDLLGGEGDRE